MPSVRRSLAAASLLLLAPALGACGFSEQTDKVYQPAVGVNNRSGQVDVLNAVVVSAKTGEGTVVASLSNESTSKSSTLSSVTATGSSKADTAKLLAPVELAPEGFVNLADKGAIAISGDGIVPGDFVRLVFTFDNGQEAAVNAPVVQLKDQWSDVAQADPSPSAPNDTASVPAASPAPAASASANP